MTKKHFIALADAIRQLGYPPNGVPNNHEDRLTYTQIEFLADFFAAQFPAFCRERWIAYITGAKTSTTGKTKP